MMDFEALDANVLKKRLTELGWTTYRLAQEVAQVRADVYGETIDDPKSLVNGINGCLKSPERSSGKMLNSIILAMGGTLTVKWTTEKIVKTTEEIEESF
jgi:hypothetical protein